MANTSDWKRFRLRSRMTQNLDAPSLARFERNSLVGGHLASIRTFRPCPSFFSNVPGSGAISIGRFEPPGRGGNVPPHGGAQSNSKLDAVFFHLYGIFDPKNRKRSHEDIQHIFPTCPIVERQERNAYDRCISRDLALEYCNSLAAGRPDAEPDA